MKARIAALIMIGCLAFGLTACSGTSLETTETKNEQGSEDLQAEESVVDAEQESEMAEEDPAIEVAAIEEQVLFDQDGVKLTAVKLEKIEEYGYNYVALTVLAENNTDQDIRISPEPDYGIVNGYTIEARGYSDITAGKKANMQITFRTEDLEICGIEKVAEIDLMFEIEELESFDDLAATNWISIQTSAGTDYVQTYDDSGQALYEDEQIRIIYKGLVEDSYSGVKNILALYMENKTENNSHVYLENIFINGSAVEGYNTAKGCPLGGTRSVAYVELYDQEGNKIEDIETVETTFLITFDPDYFEGTRTSAITIQCQ